MKPSYNLREQKIYQDYCKVTDAELQQKLENKNNYRDDIIAIIEDILVERGLLSQTTFNAAEYEVGPYISEKLFEFNAPKETVLEEIQRKFNLNEEEATKAIEQAYEEKKVEVLYKFPLKVPFDDASIMIVSGMVLAFLLDVFWIHRDALHYLDYSELFFFSAVRVVVGVFAAIYCGYKSYQLKRESVSWIIFGFCFPVLAVIHITLTRYKHPKEIHDLIKLMEEDYRYKVRKIINQESVENRKTIIQGIQEEVKVLYERILINYYVYQKLPTDAGKLNLSSGEVKTYSFRYPNLLIWPAAIISSILVISFAYSGMIAIIAVGLIIIYSVIVLATKILSKNYRERYRQYETLGLVLLGYSAILLWYGMQTEMFIGEISLVLFSLLLISLVIGYAVITPKCFIGIHARKIINDGQLYIFSRIEIGGIALFFYFLLALTLSKILRLSRFMEGGPGFHNINWVYFHLPGRVWAYYYVIFFTWVSVILYAIRKHRIYLRVVITGLSMLFLLFLIQFSQSYFNRSKYHQKAQKSMIEEEIKKQKDNFN